MNKKTRQLSYPNQRTHQRIMNLHGANSTNENANGSSFVNKTEGKSIELCREDAFDTSEWEMFACSQLPTAYRAAE